LRGAGFFQGCLLLFVAIMADSLSTLVWDVAGRIGPIVMLIERACEQASASRMFT